MEVSQIPTQPQSAIQEKPIRTTKEIDINVFVQNLQAALQRDLTITEACDQAGIPRSTYYDHLKKNPEFAEKMEQAKRFAFITAKNRAFNIMDKGEDRDAGPMIRWFLEKRQPEIYGNINIQQNVQNNIYNITNEYLGNINKQSGVTEIKPSEFLKALEGLPASDIPGEKGSTAPIRTVEIQSNDTGQTDLPQPPSTV